MTDADPAGTDGTDGTDGQGEPTPAELDARITALDGKLDTIIDRLSGQAPAAGDGAAADRPADLAAEIRRQLADQRAAEQADADRKGAADRLAAVEQRVKDMTEQAPESVVRRVENVMGWR